MAFWDRFKSKAQASQVGPELLRMARHDPDGFSAFIASMQPAERLMVFVGTSITKLTLQAVVSASKKSGQTFSLDDFVRDAEASYLRGAAKHFQCSPPQTTSTSPRDSR